MAVPGRSHVTSRAGRRLTVPLLSKVSCFVESMQNPGAAGSPGRLEAGRVGGFFCEAEPTMARRSSAKSSAKRKSPEPPTGSILQLKIRLFDVNPMVWRRVLVPDTNTLEDLHGIIQVAMGWESLHLYRFWIRAVHYGSFELCSSSPHVTLDHVRFRKGAKFTYEYDMTDFWRQVASEGW